MFENLSDNRKQVCNSCWEKISRLAIFDVEALERVDLLEAGYQFEWCKEEASGSIDLFKAFTPAVIAMLPDNDLNTIGRLSDELCGILTGISQLNMSLDGTPSNFNSYKTQLNGRSLSLADHLRPNLTLAAALSYLTSGEKKFVDDQIGLALKKFETQRLNFEELVSGSLHEVSNIRTEMNRILEEVKILVADKVISKQGDYFSKMADTSSDYSKYWLVATVALSILLTFLPFAFTWPLVVDFFSVVSNEQAILSKTMIFAIVAYGLLQCVKSWNAHRHNSIVNTQRSNALKTFEILADSVADQTSRDAILAQAVSAIFAPQDSGFIKNNTVSPPGTQAIEVIQRMVAT
jgi:hypothetical protein